MAQTLFCGLVRTSTALTSRFGCCGVEKTPCQGLTGVKGAACPARSCGGWCVPFYHGYTKEGAVLGPAVTFLLQNCELSGTT